MKKIILIFLFVLPAVCFAEKDSYSLQDLNKLKTEGNWKELLSHVEDIKPADRNKEWSILLNYSVKSAYQDVVENGDRYSIRYFLNNYVEKYTEIKKDSAFMFELAKSVRLKLSDSMALEYFSLQTQKTLMMSSARMKI